MGVYTRRDSPYYWLWLETTRSKERTDIRIGETADQRSDSRALASDRYHQRMNELAARLYKLPTAMPAIRFAKYAEEYAPAVALRKGAEREREIVKTLVKQFGPELLTAIDQDRVRRYMQARRVTVAATTVNREVGLLKSMLRDAVPKYLQASPLVGMKYLRTLKPRRRLLTRAEERDLLRHADRVEAALLILGIDGLIRLGDLLELKRGDWRGEWLYVADPKSGDPYEVALSRRAQRALQRLSGDSPYFFERYRHSPLQRDRRRAVRRALEKLCAAADVPYGKANNGITFHWATRKTGATRMILDQHIPIPAVQRQGNWKTTDVLLSIYTEADREDQRRAVGLPRRETGGNVKRRKVTKTSAT